jgi:hypothetical protein
MTIRTNLLTLMMWAKLKPEILETANEILLEMINTKPVTTASYLRRIHGCFIPQYSLKGAEFWDNKIGNNIHYCNYFEAELLDIKTYEQHAVDKSIDFTFNNDACSIIPNAFFKVLGEMCVNGVITVNGKITHRTALIPISSLINFKYDGTYRGGENPKPRFRPDE